MIVGYVKTLKVLEYQIKSLDYVSKMDCVHSV